MPSHPHDSQLCDLALMSLISICSGWWGEAITDVLCAVVLIYLYILFTWWLPDLGS